MQVGKAKNNIYPATIVTALYDIGRGQLKKEANNFRPFSSYLEWFKDLLLVNAPLVIYIPPEGPESGGYDLIKFIREHRSSEYPTRIDVQPFSTLPLYAKRSRIENVMKKINHPDPRLEFHHPNYIIMIYSKFDLLRKTIESNPFESQYFFWVDAGYFREKPGDEITFPWPDPDKLLIIGDKLLLQNFKQNTDPSNPWPTTSTLTQREKEYLAKCPNEVIACFFGGCTKTILEIGQQCLELLDEMLNQELINNEQQALSILAYRQPNNFLLYPAKKSQRGLLVDLSVASYLKVNYPTCPHLIALTVITREIKEAEFKAWLDTTSYYGYANKVLAREEKWGGWPFRTQKYLDALRQLNDTTEVAILTDGTDLFFCASAWEAYQKFKDSGERIIIGSENIIAYKESAGRHTSYQVEEFFIKQCQSRFCFPNGGFIIGYISDLIKLMEANLKSNDDQAGYMDLLYEKETTYSLDQENILIGNLPNYQGYTNRDIGFWRWDKIRHRYYNPHTNQYPVALHFPGNNRVNQMRILHEVVPQSREDCDEIKSTTWIWWIIIIIVLVFLLCIFWKFRYLRYAYYNKYD